MGEIERFLTEPGDLPGGFRIGLKDAPVPGGTRFVHIQNDAFRLQLTERDFLQIAASLCKAKMHLLHRKRLDDADA